MKEPVIKVGILVAPKVSFSFIGMFRSGTRPMEGDFTAVADQGRIVVGDEAAGEWLFEPDTEESCFEVQDVVIGIEFHWERRELQRFRGSLKLVPENGMVRVINQIPAEEYLLSVISSEMSATASTELLKAHAVISRSWLLYPILHPEVQSTTANHTIGSEGKIIRWYERDAHTSFDVCADDHCQRYQGISRATTRKVAQAMEDTRGLVLMDGDRLCDARYYKACGGVTERFDSCWADQHFTYLEPLRDTDQKTDIPDLTTEEAAREWILSSPDAFCNTTDSHVLSQVLNNYDQETIDFYRWKVVYTRDELQELIKRKSGSDFGDLLALEPLHRGPSGRITELKIVGTKQTIIVGKELEIRKWLSPSHLYSSAFVVDTLPAGAELPDQFILHGAGWGHGVGLCQIGAAVMGEKGYTYQHILNHYFSHAAIQKIY